MDNKDKKYTTGYIKKWFYFDRMKRSIKQAEINKHEILIDDFSAFEKELHTDFDKEFDDYLNNNPDIPFYEVMENEKLRTAYRSLTDREKLVIDLYYHQGFNQYEIAEMIGTKQGTVAKTLKSAIKKLFTLINEENIQKK